MKKCKNCGKVLTTEDICDCGSMDFTPFVEEKKKAAAPAKTEKAAAEKSDKKKKEKEDK